MSTLGWEGGGAFTGGGGELIFLGGGSTDIQVTPSVMQPYSMPQDNSSRAALLHQDGTLVYSGSLDFELGEGAANAVIGLMSRGQTFSIRMGDGTSGSSMTSCIADSVSLSGSAESIISGSISFKSLNAPTSTTYSGPGREITPLAYWHTGNTAVQSWSVSYSASVEPRYYNDGSMEPGYLFLGPIDASMEVTTLGGIHTHDNLAVGIGASIRLSGVTTSEGYQFLGTDSRGGGRHSFQGIAIGNSGASIIS